MIKNRKINLATATAAFVTMVGMTSMMGSAAFAATITGPANGYLIGSQFFASSAVETSNALLQELNTALSANPNAFVFELQGSFANYSQFMETNPLSGGVPIATVLAEFVAAHPVTLPAVINEVNASGGTTPVTFPGQSTSTAMVSAENSNVNFPVTFTSITDGTAFSLIATVQDVNGNGISNLTNADFSLLVGSQSITPIYTVDNGSGDYVLTFLPTIIAPTTSNDVISLVVNGVSVSGTTKVIVVGSTTPSTYNSTVTWPIASSFTAGQMVSVSMFLEDAYGNPISDLKTITVTSSGLTANSSSSVAAGTAAGTYTLTFEATTKANSTGDALSFNAGGTVFTSPSKYTIVAATANLFVVSPAKASVNGSSTNTVPVVATVTDTYGNPVPGVTVNFTVTGGSLSSSSATTDTNGEATVTYTAPNTTTAAGYGTVYCSVPGLISSSNQCSIEY